MSQRIDASFSRRSRVVIRSTRLPVTLSLVPTKCWEALELNLISSWVFSRCFGNIWSPALRWEWKWKSKTRFSRKYYTNKKIYCDFEMIGCKCGQYPNCLTITAEYISKYFHPNISQNKVSIISGWNQHQLAGSEYSHCAKTRQESEIPVNSILWRLHSFGHSIRPLSVDRN